ncbi:hypothetical protein TWF718_003795 [Orbilia javanica]|uniref:Uncharacterized protein n=1 Tax=Orbilia javanica TaxID=47235 RepID=A0AAN8RF37_9PEZI
MDLCGVDRPRVKLRRANRRSLDLIPFSWPVPSSNYNPPADPALSSHTPPSESRSTENSSDGAPLTPSSGSSSAPGLYAKFNEPLPKFEDKSSEEVVFIKGPIGTSSESNSYPEDCPDTPGPSYSPSTECDVWDDDRIAKHRNRWVKLPRDEFYRDTRYRESNIKREDGKPIYEKSSGPGYEGAKICGIPEIFYAVYCDEYEWGILKLLKEGADPNAIATIKDLFGSYREKYEPVHVEIPVLAFAILIEKPQMIQILLKFGADPSVIPGVLRLPYANPTIYQLKAPESIATEFKGNVSKEEKTMWCNDVVFDHLMRKMNMSIRYDLCKAESSRITARQRQVAKNPTWDCSRLFGLHFDLMGQEFAVKKTIQNILRFNEVDERLWCKPKPLVLLLSGPNDHGKEEMVPHMMKYLEASWAQANAAELQPWTKELAESPGASVGRSLFNQFLKIRTDGMRGDRPQRSIIFIENIEDMRDDVRSLIFGEPRTTNNRKPGDDGLLNDRRLSRAIWIFTTSILDDTIAEFYEQNQPLTPEKMKGKEGRALMARMESFISSDSTGFGVQVARKVDSIVPFFPFSKHEQLVLARRSLQQLQNRLMRPILVKTVYRGDDDDPRNLLGNVKLIMENDYQICEVISRSYLPSEGPASIEQRVQDLEKEIFYHFLDSWDEAITQKDEKNITEYILEVDEEDDSILIRTGATILKE